MRDASEASTNADSTTADGAAPAAAEPPGADVVVPGFRFAAAACGMRFTGRDDLALIACEGPATWAGVFTTSSAPGAPVVVSRERLRRARPVRAVLVNAGIANAG